MYCLVPKLPHELAVGDILALVQPRGDGPELILSEITEIKSEMRGRTVCFKNHGTISAHFFDGGEAHRTLMVAEVF